ncbi:RTT109 family histone lysine acetyltransferase [Schizosaccharomyces cryophilus OY26]|uniref:histone acetyltransferase n=1 Tax=Schizosaccharomyces cryophilus (strain OY26 / ATCC MYA-4695 / CBS 11777 / NBRC 106824 / NRRL Y48691) TaxID=653667 RepID=S9X8W4_SCHCR|nr:RTT109 family histone lysine acetyltransferase [Schizosaccharomyces cryophilus OY26]EPY50286.1 RTT109 family histone lysine acetyltransferase [Schizosaccharomyces cryophilus OY26]
MQNVWAKRIVAGKSLAVYYLQSEAEKCHNLYGKSSRSKDIKFASHLFLVKENDVFVFGMECIVYKKSNKRTIFVAKVDSSGLGTQAASSSALAASAIETVINAQYEEGAAEVEVTLFAISQSQYLFPESSENGHKHVLSDAGLLHWWVKCLEMVRKDYYPAEEQCSEATVNRNSEDVSAEKKKHMAYMFVPGLPSLRSYLPNSFWKQGTALQEGKAIEMIPRYPDDPKARYLYEIQDQRSEMSVAEFWDTLSFRQECCSGKLVGFYSLSLPKHTVEAVSSRKKNFDFGLVLPPKLYRIIYDSLLKRSFRSLSIASQSTETFLGETIAAIQRVNGFSMDKVVQTIEGNAKPVSSKKRDPEPPQALNVLQPRKKKK